MSFGIQTNDEDDCKCPDEPKWLTLAIAVLPAVLPVVVEKVMDVILSRWNNKPNKTETSVKDEPNVK